MVARSKKINKRQALDDSAIAWLAGEQRKDFFQFKPVAELESLFEEFGDHEAMFYRRGMLRPITVEELEANEESWLNSGESDEYGRDSYFIHANYSDEEKTALWNERGDKTRYEWRAGMKRPAPTES
jgi:hypothetical protein